MCQRGMRTKDGGMGTGGESSGARAFRPRISCACPSFVQPRPALTTTPRSTSLPHPRFGRKHCRLVSRMASAGRIAA
jgi:hypothetical protein